MPEAQRTVSLERMADMLVGAREGGSTWVTSLSRVTPEGVVVGRNDARGLLALLPEPEAADLRKSYEDFPIYVAPFVAGGSWKIRAESDPKEYTLDRAALERGLQVMADKCPKHFADLVGETDDADTADAFLQRCLFGQLVYG